MSVSLCSLPETFLGVFHFRVQEGMMFGVKLRVGVSGDRDEDLGLDISGSLVSL